VKLAITSLHALAVLCQNTCGPAGLQPAPQNEIVGKWRSADGSYFVEFYPTEAEKALCLFMLKHPPQCSIPLPMPTPTEVRIFRVTPTVISGLDYSRDFGHADLVTCPEHFPAAAWGDRLNKVKVLAAT
jgi:hypothetical protein